MRLVWLCVAIATCSGCSANISGTLGIVTSAGNQSVAVEATGPFGRKNTDLVMRFLTAFAKKDSVSMSKTVTSDFIWHLHTTDGDYRGRTVIGVESVMRVLEERRIDWRNVKYTDVKFYISNDRIVQTYRVQGLSNRFGEFDANGVDLYTIRDHRIARKDSYWKQ